MKTIEEGIITSMSKSRMDELEQQRAEIEDKILMEKCKMGIIVSLSVRLCQNWGHPSQPKPNISQYSA